eukprot:CAMPEP_0119557766 /NCGR_PEP_ID=MMETSP1352-20130426/9316_1 /TAXON_ID=265584 /ORGANISM="Stauroneis constricta, Strain CCMP1120" /LENGTH=332 /DNA_ID=CAMNT_0007604907 /DNA_START=146 /DNA_END=1144 /DNA_ORIENTATION=+
MWGVSSCRFLYVDFISDRGNDFNAIFLDPTADTEPIEQRIGAGLFTWLDAFEEDDWSRGSCTGYSEAVLSRVLDTTLDAARIFAVLSVLLGWGVIFWIIFLSCISLGRYQIWMLRCICGVEIFFTGFTMLIFQSRLCKRLVESRGHESKCTIDQGGLVVIAACILWSVAFLITCLYIKPRELDMTIVNGRIANAFDERLASRKAYGVFGPKHTKRRHQQQRQQQQYEDENEYYTEDHEQEYYDENAVTKRNPTSSPTSSEEVDSPRYENDADDYAEHTQNRRASSGRRNRRRDRRQQQAQDEQEDQPAYNTSPIAISGTSMQDGTVELELDA